MADFASGSDCARDLPRASRSACLAGGMTIAGSSGTGGEASLLNWRLTLACGVGGRSAVVFAVAASVAILRGAGDRGRCDDSDELGGGCEGRGGVGGLRIETFLVDRLRSPAETGRAVNSLFPAADSCRWAAALSLSEDDVIGRLLSSPPRPRLPLLPVSEGCE